MDPNQFQMGKSKLFIKDPASVRFSFNLKPQSKEVRANWCCFSNYESDLPRFARSSKLDQHPCPLAFHISPDQKLNKSNLRQNPGSRFSFLSCSCWRRCGRGSSTTMPGWECFSNFQQAYPRPCWQTNSIFCSLSPLLKLNIHLDSGLHVIKYRISRWSRKLSANISPGKSSSGKEKLPQVKTFFLSTFCIF